MGQVLILNTCWVLSLYTDTKCTPILYSKGINLCGVCYNSREVIRLSSAVALLIRPWAVLYYSYGLECSQFYLWDALQSGRSTASAFLGLARFFDVLSAV